jgi:hypothetical protein
MDKNKETLAAMLRLSAAAWHEFETNKQDMALFEVWYAIDRAARAYGKDFYKNEQWGLFLVAEDILRTL